MKKPRLAVQHWVACLDARVIPPVGVNNFYELIGVGHVHTFAGDVEFPATLPVLAMFTRFVNGTGVKQFEVELIWIDAPGKEQLMERFPPLQVTFRPNEPLRDSVFRFLNVPLGGTGRHVMRLSYVGSRRKRELANEYFSVVQLP